MTPTVSFEEEIGVGEGDAVGEDGEVDLGVALAVEEGREVCAGAVVTSGMLLSLRLKLEYEKHSH